MASITCFDGVGCIGGNKILLEDGDCRLFFDFGRNFGAEGRFYEEFIQPKNCAGIYEYIQMGLLPPFADLYREDMISGQCDPWGGIETRRLGDVGGVLVSHAHVDHIGSLHHLRTDIPIFCSPMTAAISRVLQDTGRSASEAEYCYYVNRIAGDSGALGTPHYRTHPYISRKYHLTKPPADESFKVFWANVPGSRELEALSCDVASVCAGLNVRSFPVDHSVYGATAWAVETSAGWVVYAGDVRLHGTYADYTRCFAEAVAALQPVALILEGTRITSDSSHTEATVRDACFEVVKRCSGLVVADFGPRNVERLISFLQIARDTGRELVILPNDAYLLDAMLMVEEDQRVSSLDEPGFRIYWEHMGSTSKWREQIRDRYPGLGITPQEVARRQGDYICCFSFFDVQELAYIKPVPGSVWISSNCEPFNEEMQIDQDRLLNWIRWFGMEYVGGDAGHNSPFHVSGHASGKDLVEIVRTIRPKKLIPVHCAQPQLYAERVGDICSVVLPDCGAGIEI